MRGMIIAAVLFTAACCAVTPEPFDCETDMQCVELYGGDGY